MPRRQKAKKLAQQGATRKEIKQATGFKGKQAQRFVNRYAPSVNNSQPNTSNNTQTSNQNTTKPLTGNAVKDGRYGVGAQKEARNNYQMLIDQGVTDAFDPGRPGSRANIMADGFVGKKELSKFAKRKEINESQARARLSRKGASFTGGANKLADSVFSKNNPFLTMMIGTGSDPYGALGALGKNKQRQLQIYGDSSTFDYGNKLKSGEVFEFRKKNGMVGAKPNPNIERLNQIFGNPIVGVDNGDENGDGNDNNSNNAGNETTTGGDGTDVVTPTETTTTDPGVGQMSGGGMGAMGATKLGRARSRLQRLGILNRGTGLFGRGLQYGNALNT